jgi:hypothetical protein
MMFHTFNIFVGDEYVCTLRALTADSAIDRAYMTHGGSSAYSGYGKNQFRAELVS